MLRSPPFMIPSATAVLAVLGALATVATSAGSAQIEIGSDGRIVGSATTIRADGRISAQVESGGPIVRSASSRADPCQGCDDRGALVQAHAHVGDDSDGAVEEKEEEDADGKAKEGGSAREVDSAAEGDTALNDIQGKLEVTEIYTFDLENQDVWDANDVYVSMYLSSEGERKAKRTSTRHNCGYSKWGSSCQEAKWPRAHFEFDISSSAEKLNLVVYDEDKFGRDDKLGEVKDLSFAEAIAKGPYSVVYRKKLYGDGKLTFVLRFRRA